MRIRGGFLVFSAAVSLACSSACVADTSAAGFSISGSGALEEGQYRHSYNAGPETAELPYPSWLNRGYVSLKVDATINTHLRVVLAPEFRMWSNTYAAVTENNIGGLPFRQFSSAYIMEGEGIFTFGDLRNNFFQCAMGIMPFKYNEDAHNLGEYLFRSGAYPCYVVTTFDYPYATLTGLRLSGMLFGKLRQDLLLTTETQVQPLLDWSLSYLVGCKIPSLLDIGAGASLYRYFPIAEELTTPHASQNSYLTVSKEEKYYSFKGIKLMGRASFNCKSVLPEYISGIMGREDARFFIETAVLGLENYTPYVYNRTSATDSVFEKDTVKNYYTDITKRIPLMFGCNIPVFKLLDVLSVQGEWYGWNFSNSLYSNLDYKKVIPLPTLASIPPEVFRKNKWSWSVYAKKRVMEGFSITGQIAHDHSFNESYYETKYSPVQAFITKRGWGWWLKLQYSL